MVFEIPCRLLLLGLENPFTGRGNPLSVFVNLYEVSPQAG
jgi:hypothetical protein